MFLLCSTCVDKQTSLLGNEMLVLRSIRKMLLRSDRFMCLKGEQAQTQAVDLEEYPEEGSLIGKEARKQRRSRWLMHHLESCQPVLPAGIEMPSDPNAIVHQPLLPRGSLRCHKDSALSSLETVVESLPKGEYFRRRERLLGFFLG